MCPARAAGIVTTFAERRLATVGARLSKFASSDVDQSEAREVGNQSISISIKVRKFFKVRIDD